MKTNTITRTCSLLIMSFILILAVSCEKLGTTDQSGTISDDSFYEEVGYTMIKCLTDIYNQNLAGKPTGNQNITADGPMGGTVVITGSNTYDATHGITTANIVMSLNSVKYTYNYTDKNNKNWFTQVTLTGDITYTGSFSDSYVSLNHQSDNLNIIGSVTYEGTVRNISGSGSVSINRSSTISVDIFGNNVAW